MKTKMELYDERTHIIKSCEELVDKAQDEHRVMLKEETGIFDGLQVDIANITTEIDALEETEKRKAISDAAVAELKKIREQAVTPTKPAVNGLASDPDAANRAVDIRMSDGVRRYAKLKAFVGPNAERNAYRSGMWLRATIFRDDVARQWCQQNGIEVRAHSIGVNAAGGALVPEEFSQAIIDLRETYGVFRQNATVMPMGRDVMVVPRQSGNGTATFTSENTALTESESTFDNVELTAKKMGRIVRMSTEVAEDAIINIADMIAKDIAWSFAFLEDTIGFNGNGSAAHGGINGIITKIEADPLLEGYVDAITGNDSHLTLDADDFGALMGTCPAFARPNAKFYVSPFGWDAAMSRLAIAGGGNTTNNLQAGMSGLSFLGHDVILSSVMAGSGTQNNVALVLFGDLSMASLLGDRRGFSVATSADRYFELDQIAIKATTRIDIANHGIGDATDAGPIVALIGNT